jgi:Flp pilus assembly CpaF family ATPase
MVRESSSLPVDVINTLIASAINIIVHLKRTHNGGRCIDNIVNINGYSEGEFVIEKV